MCLMDVITAYLYGSIDNDIYIKILEGFRFLEENNIKPRSMCLIKLQRSLYGLKQSGHVTPPTPTLADEGARNRTGTLYLLFQTFVSPSLIIESKYYIHRYKNKTTTIVVFIVSIHTVLSPIYIYIWKNCTFTFTYSERETYCGGLLLMCWPSSVWKIANVLICTYTD